MSAVSSLCFLLSLLFPSFLFVSLVDPGSLSTDTKLTLVSEGWRTQGVKALGDVCQANKFYIRQDLVGYLVPFKYLFHYHIV